MNAGHTLVAAGSPASALDARIAGSFRHRFWQELWRNSAHFPVANLLFELLLDGPGIFRAPDIYVLVLAALTQAWVITRFAGGRPIAVLLGNLVGPAIYTAVELPLEAGFAVAPNHVAYWGFAIVLGALQWAQRRVPDRARSGMLIVAESTVRASILFVMYAIFEFRSGPPGYAPANFLADPSHVFIGVATLILGMTAGFETRAGQGYLQLLRETSTQLKRYSEWLLGSDLLERVIADPAALTLTRRERSVLFMDIRGFTGWSERCTPETIAQALNEYYAAAEPVLRSHGAIKVKFSADEVLAVFEQPRQAAACGLALRERSRAALARWELGVGIGMHCGPVVEGLMGSQRVQAYDVIGDTVNTAKRIEGAAAGNEVLASAGLLAALGPGVAAGARRDVVAKGKAAPIEVYPLLQ